MAEELKNLIDKIQKEGIESAQNKAKEIEEQAVLKAKEIVEKAKKEAGSLILEAKERAVKIQESTSVSLRQSARDTMLSLKKEINNMLERIVRAHIDNALNPQELTKIITALVKNHGTEGKNQIVISLKKEDAQILERGLLGELSEEIKKGVVLKPSDEIRGGFTISFDSGKSQYDFSDKALAEYIGSYLKPSLSQIFKDIDEPIKKT